MEAATEGFLPSTSPLQAACLSLPPDCTRDRQFCCPGCPAGRCSETALDELPHCWYRKQRQSPPTAAHNMLQEDAETVRFNESAKAAQDSVNKVLESYGALAQQLDEEERGKLQRSMGMKMEQLKVRALMSSTSASLMC